jgi:drug/metabolite transporter (DMT)-like permease
MVKPMEEETLDLKAAGLLTGVCILWGVNAVTIKISNLGIDPVFTAGLRSVVAAVCLMIWMKQQKMKLFPGKILDGLAVGVLFRSSLYHGLFRMDTPLFNPIFSCLRGPLFPQG